MECCIIHHKHSVCQNPLLTAVEAVLQNRQITRCPSPLVHVRDQDALLLSRTD
jgi:hypothetical protein